MLIIGCDFHTRYQQIAMLDEATGEVVERRLDHLNGEAEAFYRSLPPVRVGIEATGPIRWFQQLLAELGHQLWGGPRGGNSRAGGSPAEDRHAGRPAPSGTAAQQSFPAHLGAVARRAGRAATVAAPLPAGGFSNLGEEPVARSSHGARRVPEKKVVVRPGPPGTGTTRA